MTAIYTSLINHIKETLEGVDSVKQIIPYPIDTAPEKQPYVVFFPDSFDNDFASTKENMKLYRFKMWIVVGTKQVGNALVFSTILPKVVDDVVAAFDGKWDAGNLDGHRVWALLNSCLWGLTPTDKGTEAWCEMNLVIKMQTTN